ncbi:MAG TPA: secondary thiamine-phosphate synthase enzyme YjbQ [Candidatus Saccharimonadales bacterium]|nr:secondary thiamine-phosphate synthase enzyme YjbQ [Candidatus Saccharimonadales bacterium]
MVIDVTTQQNRQIIDITDEVKKNLPDGSGLVNIFVMHTTCAITTADLDPGTDLDFLDMLKAITPNIKWRHPHNPEHAPSHLLSSIIGPDVNVPFEQGKLQLGTWQRIILVELDGPRTRQINLAVVNA